MASTILYQPYAYDDGDELTCRAATPVSIGRLVMVVGDRVGGNVSAGHAPAGGYCIGVAGSDAAAGDVFTAYGKGIMRVLAGATITAGQSLMVNTTGDGTVIPWATGNPVIGYAIENTASGAFASVRFII
jgi:hypothetical protein